MGKYSCSLLVVVRHMSFTAAVLSMVVASGESEGKLTQYVNNPLLPALTLTLAELTLTTLVQDLQEH